MRIGGLQKTSVIDFPGKVSCVVFFCGCNFRCPYCHNPDLIQPSGEPLMSVDGFLEFLAARKGFLDGVVITGGEPCINTDIADFCRTLKEEGFAVKLDTNGSKPEVLRALIREELVDYVAMDVKTDPARYAELTRSAVAPDTIIDSVQTLKNAGIDYEFRTTCAPPFVDSDAMVRIMNLIAGAPLYVLQQYRPERRVLDQVFFDDYPALTREELDIFRTMAAEKVGECIIR